LWLLLGKKGNWAAEDDERGGRGRKESCGLKLWLNSEGGVEKKRGSVTIEKVLGKGGVKKKAV